MLTRASGKGRQLPLEDSHFCFGPVISLTCRVHCTSYTSFAKQLFACYWAPVKPEHLTTESCELSGPLFSFGVGQTECLTVWESILQTSVTKRKPCVQALSLPGFPGISVLHEKKCLSPTVARVLNLTFCWICHPLPDSSDHDLIYAPLNLSKKCIRNSRGWSQLLHFSCEIPVNTSESPSYCHFCNYCLALPWDRWMPAGCWCGQIGQVRLTALIEPLLYKDLNQLFMLTLEDKISDPSWGLKSRQELAIKLAQLSPAEQGSKAITTIH